MTNPREDALAKAREARVDELEEALSHFVCDCLTQCWKRVPNKEDCFSFRAARLLRTEVDDGILDRQIQFCPTCNTELETSFGMAGGGFGAYGYCPKCERVRWKVVCDE